MSPNTLVQYVRFLHDQFSENQVLLSLITSFKKPAPASTVRANPGIPQQKPAPSLAITQAGAIKALDALQEQMSPLFNATKEEREVLAGFGISEYANAVAYEQMKSRARESQAKAEADWMRVSKDVQVFLSKLNVLFESLNQFPLGFISVPEGCAEMEVIFERNASIDDVVGAKEWFNRWYHIIDGYSRLLGKSKEDFLFVGLSKESPTKLRIRATITDIGLVMGILGVLLQIQDRFIQKQVLIEQMKATRLVTPEADAEHIRKAEEALRADEQKELERVAEDQLKLSDIDDAEVKVFFTKSVENQYNFIVNGGVVNIILPSGATVEQLDALDSYKEERRRVSETQRRLEIVSGKGQRSLNDTIPE